MTPLPDTRDDLPVERQAAPPPEPPERQRTRGASSYTPGDGAPGRGSLDGDDPDMRGALSCLELLDRVWPDPLPKLTARDLGLATADDGAPATLGRFQIRRQLGQGGCGIVFLAHDPLLNRPVALKVPRPEALFSPSMRQRFLREAQAAAALEHPNVVPIYEAAESGVLCYIASAYCPGATLRDWLKNQAGPVPVRSAAALVATLAEAIHYTHQQGVLHRDLKPGNVMLVPAEGAGGAGGRPAEELPLEQLTPRVTDFGLAKVLEDDSAEPLTRPGAVFGTPAYMAPEQAHGNHQAGGPQTDVYALGVVLFEVLTGRVPFQANSHLDLLNQVTTAEPPVPSSLRSSVHRDLEVICLKCLAKEPDQRYASAADLAAELRRFLNGEPIRTRPATRLERWWRWGRRNPLGAALAAVSALVLGVCLPGLTWYQVRLTRAVEELDRAERLTSAARGAKEQADRARESAQAAALLQEYFALVDRARDRITQGGLGWTFEAADLLARAARLPVAARNEPELRTLAAACAAGIDFRERQSAALPALIHAVAYSPDGKTLAAAESRGFVFACKVTLLDAASGRVTRTLTFAPKPVQHRGKYVPDGARALAFSDDGKALAVGTRGGWVHLWDLTQDQPAPRSWQACADGSGAVDQLLFLPGRGGIVTLSQEARQLRRWDPDRPGTELASLQQEHRPTTVARNRSGDALAFVGDAGLVLLDGQSFEELQSPWKVRPALVAFDPSNRFLALAQDGRIALLDVASGAVFKTFPPAPEDPAHEGGIDALLFSRDGALLFSTSDAEEDRRVRAWEVSTGRPVASWVVGQSGPLPLAVSPTRFALAAVHDARVALYEGAGLREQTYLAQHAAPLGAARFSPNGKYLGCVGIDALQPDRPLGFATVWALDGAVGAGPVLTHTAERHGASGGPALAFLPDSDTLAAVGLGQHLDLVPLDPARPAKQLVTGDLGPAALGPDGAIWCVRGQQVVECWSAGGERRARWSNASAMIFTGKPQIYSLAAGATYVAAGGRDGLVRLLQAADGKLATTLPGDGAPVRSLALAGDVLAVGSQKGGLRLLRLPEGAELSSRADHRDGIEAAAFSPDGRLLATGGRDRRIHLYAHDAGKLTLLLTLAASGPIADLAFHPGGDRLAVTVQREHAVRLWRLDRLAERLRAMGLGGLGT